MAVRYLISGSTCDASLIAQHRMLPRWSSVAADGPVRRCLSHQQGDQPQWPARVREAQLALQGLSRRQHESQPAAALSATGDDLAVCCSTRAPALDRERRVSCLPGAGACQCRLLLRSPPKAAKPNPDHDMQITGQLQQREGAVPCASALPLGMTLPQGMLPSAAPQPTATGQRQTAGLRRSSLAPAMLGTAGGPAGAAAGPRRGSASGGRDPAAATKAEPAPPGSMAKARGPR